MTQRADAPGPSSSAVRCTPLSPETWPDFEVLFGPRGACGGCWCMTWRLASADYERSKGDANKVAMRALVDAGEPTGVLAYHGETPIGWCSVAPRRAFVRLQRSRLLKPVDDQPVWSIVCLFIAPAWRRRGVSRTLIREALAYARERGARVVEAYPVEPRKPDMPPLFAFTGIASAFRLNGFEEVARREQRPILRRRL